MSPRALAAAAVLTAAVAAPAAGQAPGFARVGEPAPLAPTAPVGIPAGNPFAFAPQPPGMLPPVEAPAGPGPVVAPAVPPPVYAGPELPTDGLGYGGGPRGPSWWVGVEYLLFWTRRAPVSVPLATAGPSASLGVLGQPGVRTVVGNDEVAFHTFSGVRVNAGYWVTENQTLGVESSLFVLPSKSNGTPPVVGVPGLPALARPFFDTALNRQNSRLLSLPNTFSGGIQTEATQMVWGAEVVPVWRFYDRGGPITLDALGGFKFFSLEESLTIKDFAAAGPNGVANFNGQQFRAPAVTYVQDRFATANRFYGTILGLRANAQYEAFTLGLSGKLGVGNVRQQIRVDGSTTLTGPSPAPQLTPGGFFATGTNSGDYDKNHFAVLPELGLNLSVRLTGGVTLTLGYTGMYLTDVVRPGDQLSTNINNTLIPTGQNYGARFGPLGPGLPFTTSNFWAQGFNFGFAYGY